MGEDCLGAELWLLKNPGYHGTWAIMGKNFLNHECELDFIKCFFCTNLYNHVFSSLAC